ncbi:tetraspanin-8-like [Sphaeramia orbicularis]|uniref:Tetraspanin-8-like n=1 Tax=Sphaeramia orbicularis TaxID=375764 RepID=A0A673BVU7_9TELE|nr:tetraspanin-8-like [Sphaeramia orbicularis]
MGKVNVCLERSYILVSTVVGIISALLLAMTLFSHGYFHEDEEIERMLPGIKFMYSISIISLLLVVTGIYGVSKKKKWMLIFFVVGMILSILFMSATEILALSVGPQITQDIREQYLDLLPLSNTSEGVIEDLKDIQMELQCCGLDQGYLDWGYNISESCLCAEDAMNPCVAAPRNSSLFEHSSPDEPIMIYKEPCIPYLIAHAINSINIVFGTFLGLVLLWVLSVVLCIVILCQLNRKEDTPVVVYSAEAKAGNYSALTDTVEYT